MTLFGKGNDLRRAECETRDGGTAERMHEQAFRNPSGLLYAGDRMNLNHPILYFSGTGNSLVVARLLSKRLPRTAIFSVTEVLRWESYWIEAGACGIVFPVYFQNSPEIVQRLVRRLRFPSEAYIYSVATHNGDPGYCHFTLDAILRRNGQQLKAGFAVLMPGNSIIPRVSMSTEEERDIRLKATAACIDGIAANINQKAELPYAGSNSMRKRIKGLRNMIRHKYVHRVHEKFWISEACNQCGICIRICPENNIRLKAGNLVWGKQCQMCQACIHWCPQIAVQNGAGTVDCARYHHPDITVNDMYLSIHKECTSALQ